MSRQANKKLGRGLQLGLLVVFLTIATRGYSQQIEFENDTLDIGKMAYKPGMKAYLKFKNTGSDTLRFLDLPATSSGGEIATLLNDQTNYAPQQEGAIVYSFETKGPGKFKKSITVVTNAAPQPKELFVQWEIIPEVVFDPIQDKKFPDKASFNTNLRQMEQFGCYGSLSTIQSSSFSDSRETNQSFCDSIRSVAIQTLNTAFTCNELIRQACINENEMVRLVCFEALTRSNCKTDSLLAVFEAECRRSMKKPPFYGSEWAVYYRMMDIISPPQTFFPKSKSLDLESLVFVRSLILDQKTANSGERKSFVLKRSTLNFGTIDVTKYPMKDGTFVLRGKIHVKNNTKQLIVIAPYYDLSTRCDKRSYRLQPNDQIEINFWSTVRLNEMDKPVHRSISVVNYLTKERQAFSFDAEFKRQ